VEQLRELRLTGWKGVAKIRQSVTPPPRHLVEEDAREDAIEDDARAATDDALAEMLTGALKTYSQVL
jgi:hypothetical protein